MKILYVNKYFFIKGGSEVSFFETAKLLENNGHQALFLSMDNPKNFASRYSYYFIPHIDYDNMSGILKKMRLAGRIIYSWEARKKISQLILNEKPDLAHLHNISHQISPSIIDELARNNIPIVMTMHDYKLVCPTYNLLGNGKVCEKCSQGRFVNCLLNRCTKGSFAKSAINAIEMYLHHNIFDIYGKVGAFIAPSQFLSEKVQEMGFTGKIFHLPYFIKASEFNPAFSAKAKSLVYFGRLSPEKGLDTLIAAAQGLGVALKIIGEGPQMHNLQSHVEAEGIKNIFFLGFKSGENLHEEIRNSLLVVVPSIWYENYPMAIIEAFALGKPVIGSRIGGIPEMVRDHETGFTFEPGNAADLREKIRFMLDNIELLPEMGQKARRFVEDELSPEKHFEKLMSIYQQAG
jgi:glycosyltransferase involved in cell wall biosynthesis